MASISPMILEPVLVAGTDPLASELLGRLRRHGDVPACKVTRPIPRGEALKVYRQKAAAGDRPHVRTEGYPELLAALSQAGESEVLVHGVAFSDVVYLVFTDAGRTRCVGVLRKIRLQTVRN